jgi:hypothetical protein
MHQRLYDHVRWTESYNSCCFHLFSSKYGSLSVILAFTKSGIRCRGAQELFGCFDNSARLRAEFPVEFFERR